MPLGTLDTGKEFDIFTLWLASPTRGSAKYAGGFDAEHKSTVKPRVSGPDCLPKDLAFHVAEFIRFKF
jgi:hypothetical protein